MVNRDLDLTLGEDEVLAAKLTILDDCLFSTKVAREHCLGQDSVVLRIDVLRQE